MREWNDESKMEAALTAPRLAFVPAPDTEVVDRPDLSYVITPSVPQGSYNEVFVASFSDEDVESEIDRALARYRSNALPVKWVVGPGSRPADLAERLKARGLIEWRARAMCCDPATHVPQGAEDIVVERVDDATLPDYASTILRGIGGDERLLWARLRRVREHAGARHHMVVARIAGEPVGAAEWVELPSSAYLSGAIVLPELRGRGIYRSMIAARLHAARERGVSLATTHAREHSSAPILERLGFETLYRYRMLATRDAAPKEIVDRAQVRA